MTEIIDTWKEALASDIIPGKREILQRFFKTGPGQYGEGDIFLGNTVPAVRKISRLMADAPFEAIDTMLASPVHDHRLSALLVLVERYRRARKAEETRRREIVDFYLAHTRGINNWDLVDLTAPKIIGEYICESGRTDILDRLSRSSDLWEQRIAIVSTWTLLKNNITAPTIAISRRYLNHPHDLIHKATGWMLREMGKRGHEDQLYEFLDLHAAGMPRTMLRYAIEKLDGPLRKHYLELRSSNKQTKI